MQAWLTPLRSCPRLSHSLPHLPLPGSALIISWKLLTSNRSSMRWLTEPNSAKLTEYSSPTVCSLRGWNIQNFLGPSLNHIKNIRMASKSIGINELHRPGSGGPHSFSWDLGEGEAVGLVSNIRQHVNFLSSPPQVPFKVSSSRHYRVAATNSLNPTHPGT